MKYIRIKPVLQDHTTLSIVLPPDTVHYKYAEKDGYEYYGVETDVIALQYPECEAVELSFAEMQEVLSNCKYMSDVNDLIENEIRKKYSIGKEFAMLNLDRANLDYIAYRDYVGECKDKFNPLKVKYGLKQ